MPPTIDPAAVVETCQSLSDFAAEEYQRGKRDGLKASAGLLAASKAISTFLDGWCTTQCSCASKAKGLHEQLVGEIRKAEARQ